MEQETINQYFISCNRSDIKEATSYHYENGFKNDAHYTKTLIERKNLYLDEVEKNVHFDLKTKKRLQNFGLNFSLLQQDIIRFLKRICEYNEGKKNDTTGLAIDEYRIKRRFLILQDSGSYIKYLITNDEYKTAIKAQDYLLRRLKGFPLFFKSWYQIDILKSPFNTEYEQLLLSIKNSLDIEKIKVLTTFDRPQTEQTKQAGQSETQKTQKTNPYPEVFKGYKEYRLFDRLHSEKKDGKTLLADFSFIYRMMREDNFLCAYQKPEVFREWLSNEPYSIVLDNKFKTLDRCSTTDKRDNYTKAKIIEGL